MPLLGIDALMSRVLTHFCPPAHFKGRAAVWIHYITPMSALQ